MKYTDLCARLLGWAKDIQTGSTAIWAMDQDLKQAAAAIRELEARVRESAMQELASLGQAQEAYEAQLAAEGRVAELTRERDAVEALVRAGEIRFFQTGQAETPAAPLKMEPWVRLADRGEAARRV